MLNSIAEYFPFHSYVRHITPDDPLKFIDQDHSWDLSSFVDKHCPAFSDGSLTLMHPMLPTGDLQTIYAALNTFEDRDIVYYRRLVLTYADGGEGTADFAVPKFVPSEYVPPNQKKPLLPHYSYYTPEEAENLHSEDTKPLLIALHGLTGGSNESYVRALLHKITKDHGFEACVLNSRGCCNSTITTPQLYNGVWTDDVRDFVKKLRVMFPNRKFYMVGFSLGASVLANYIGQEGDDTEIECAAVIANPWDLCNSSYLLRRSLLGKHIYSPVFARRLVELVEDHFEVLNKDPYMAKLYAEKLPGVRTIEDFDNYFTSRMFGFNTSFEYYRFGTSSNRLSQVRTPLLAINAKDDPIVGSEALPMREVQENPYVLLLETSKGGHIGWFTPNGDRWYTEPLAQFFSSFHSEIASKSLKTNLQSIILPHKNKFVQDRLVNATLRDY
ncbi:LAFE_0G08504g1_1 [Lachancea fermentati]|uniref:LAFE_0G08504g1_1 n=1 Tax=Lachancea fermentati TaxID=4955 RepID=A0A1G4MHY9_LACFM|nr:LAFE_0G08504g1_1 [Lachancea fermentati]